MKACLSIPLLPALLLGCALTAPVYAEYAKKQTRFEGALLRDLVRSLGMQKLDSVVVFTRDGAAHVVSAEDWRKYPIMIATREQGRFLSHQGRMPAQLIYPISEHPELVDAEPRSNWLLEIVRIEPYGQLQPLRF